MERNATSGVLITCALAAVLGVVWWSMSRRPAVTVVLPSVAVLPFKAVGEGSDYLAAGLTEALTKELGQLQGLRVIASSAAFMYRQDPTLREMSRELGVGLVVSGSVRRDNTSLGIDASVVSTSDGATLWSEHFNRPVTAVLTVQRATTAVNTRSLPDTF